MSFSALQRAENSSNVVIPETKRAPPRFSALQRAENSSKIWNGWMDSLLHRFSALQRAENSSNAQRCTSRLPAPPFQCSSASRKFLKAVGAPSALTQMCSFSALQRAENSSNQLSGERLLHNIRVFQCSSASRKFLKMIGTPTVYRAEAVSVLFSEPKIPQIVENVLNVSPTCVSVLFSEPKIPQSPEGA